METPNHAPRQTHDAPEADNAAAHREYAATSRSWLRCLERAKKSAAACRAPFCSCITETCPEEDAVRFDPSTVPSEATWSDLYEALRASGFNQAADLIESWADEYGFDEERLLPKVKP